MSDPNNKDSDYFIDKNPLENSDYNDTNHHYQQHSNSDSQSDNNPQSMQL
eukprot:CAMPEP_0116900868 /NCGR_PEP_ID=MMETSP0467-20121206/8981_1 /TAXON_ID=283647 /ORGANISM="Mesodinium pulex, Strain SPMC105" /LENGTH=49 /DNA_ID=CAMNT_0004574207 /DNA_START=318 /DNA_END=467 /DNA_ORIENTATION=+